MTIDEKIEKLRCVSFVLGIKYALRWLEQAGRLPNAWDLKDAVVRDGEDFLNQTSGEEIGPRVGHA